LIEVASDCWERGRAGSPTVVFLSVGVLDPPAMSAQREQVGLARPFRDAMFIATDLPPLTSDFCSLPSQQDQYPSDDAEHGQAGRYHWRESHVEQRQEVRENQPQAK